MKTVTCAICKEEVSKRQTLAIGNGKRACRKHTEAQQSSAILLQKEKLEKEKKEEEEQKKRGERLAAYRIPTEPTCGICGNVGMRAEEFYPRLLVEMEKYEMTRGKAPNMFNPDPKELNEMKGSLAGVRCLFRITIDAIKKKRKKKKIRLTREAWNVAQLIGLTFVCADCIHEHDIEHPVPEIDLDQMMRLGTIVGALIRPGMKKKALDELSKDQ